jgi:hypothetical protein
MIQRSVLRPLICFPPPNPHHSELSGDRHMPSDEFLNVILPLRVFDTSSATVSRPETLGISYILGTRSLLCKLDLFTLLTNTSADVYLQKPGAAVNLAAILPLNVHSGVSNLFSHLDAPWSYDGGQRRQPFHGPSGRSREGGGEIKASAARRGPTLHVTFFTTTRAFLNSVPAAATSKTSKQSNRCIQTWNG